MQEAGIGGLSMHLKPRGSYAVVGVVRGHFSVLQPLQQLYQLACQPFVACSKLSPLRAAHSVCTCCLFGWLVSLVSTSSIVCRVSNALRLGGAAGQTGNHSCHAVICMFVTCEPCMPTAPRTLNLQMCAYQKAACCASGRHQVF